jgi:AmmeMemoRadiSam system protein A
MSTVPVESRGSTLIAIARAAIMAATPPRPAAWGEAWLREPGASFVTLKLDGELRGCIGTIEPHRALGDDVAHNAYAAAYRDPRFDPVDTRERARLQVEVSVLSPREPLAAMSEREALAALRPGVDGLVLQYGGLGATFLPQVWESLPQPAEFLDHLRRKAGLPAGFWHPDLKLSRYTVEKYA